ncbi:MAG: NADPH-dependent F420 reductase [Methanomicrobiales archaeon]|nr:NADPH-dependent F420 reductase [Methanomicrobiales archaeon]
MKVGIVGGTGEIGEGMALRLSQRHEVFIGSRERDKAQTCSLSCRTLLGSLELPCRVQGCDNQEAVDSAEIVILAVPFPHAANTISTLKGFGGKIVVSPINPIQRAEYFFHAPPPEGSAGLMVKRLLPADARLCVAFNNIAANRWRDLEKPLRYSVAVCGDDPTAKERVMELAGSVPELEAFDAGPLAVSPMVESLTPLLLNIGKYSRMKDVGVRFL